MNPSLTPAALAVRHQANIELLAARHYEQVYGLFNAFHDNPALCLELTDRTFRDAAGAGLSTASVFSHAVACLKSRPGLTPPVATASYESNVAWMLKEIAGFTYSDIGQAMGLSKREVAERIAEIRMSVLEQCAA